jgi:hypothetical protein
VDNFSKSYDENQIRSERARAGRRAYEIRRGQTNSASRSEVPYSCHTDLFSS